MPFVPFVPLCGSTSSYARGLGLGLGLGAGSPGDGLGDGEGVWAGIGCSAGTVTGFATSVPLAAGVFGVRPFATFLAGTNVHFCVAPAIGVSVNLLPIFFARMEIIVGGAVASVAFTCSATAV